ncbi:Sperm-associated antigen 1 (Infertility-related sperm protein Spag-1) (TPR-containing protein involved in spermatogenesis) (TPIS), partial [Durusdinium trenchii]
GSAPVCQEEPSGSTVEHPDAEDAGSAEEGALAELRRLAAKPLSNPYVGLKPCPSGGYEFREKHSTKFPQIELQEGETDLQAAYRVAAECRQKGLDAFQDGTKFVAAQDAVDSWGQGILALHRLRNLSARAVSESDQKALQLLQGSQPVQSVNALELVLRLNIAQALIKLRQHESALSHCQAALDLDPKNMKALWRKAKTLWALRCPGEAKDALEDFLKVDPGNPAARAMLLEIETEELKRKAKRVGPKFALDAKKAPRSDRTATEANDPAGSVESRILFCCRRKRKQM